MAVLPTTRDLVVDWRAVLSSSAICRVIVTTGPACRDKAAGGVTGSAIDLLSANVFDDTLDVDSDSVVVAGSVSSPVLASATPVPHAIAAPMPTATVPACNQRTTGGWSCWARSRPRRLGFAARILDPLFEASSQDHYRHEIVFRDNFREARHLSAKRCTRQ
jgi:hypothetical protein